MDALPDPTGASSTAPSGSRAGVGALRQHLSSVGRFLRTASGWVPLSGRGLLAVPLLVWLLRGYALDRHDRVLLMLTLGGLALVGLCSVSVLAAGLWLRGQTPPLPGEPWSTHAGNPFRTGLVLSGVSRIPFLLFRVAWDAPTGIGIGLEPHPEGLAEEATPRERGLHAELARRFTVSDAFGLTRITFSRRQAQGMSIRPAPGRVRPVDLCVNRSVGDDRPRPEGEPLGDRVEMRTYAPGDPLKLVLWKTYARTGRLLVRTPERAFSPTDRTMAYLIAGPDDEPTAGVACALVEGGALGPDFRFGADGGNGLVATTGEAVDLVIRSAAARQHGGAGLADFLAEATSEGLQSCLLFCPCRPGRWLERLEECVPRSSCRPRILIGIDGEPASDRERWRRWLLADAADGRVPLRDLTEVCRRLAEQGAEVAVVDRLSGTNLDLAETVWKA